MRNELPCSRGNNGTGEARAAVVTTSRSDVDYIVTEYCAARLRGKPIPARVKEMINIANPDFRRRLKKEAKENKLLID
jgi:acyl-CoA hydrolase